MKKILAMLIGSVILCTSLAGCGGSTPATPSTPGEQSTGSQASSAEKIVIKVGHGIAENTGMHMGWVKFKEEVEAASGGNITVEIYPNQQMGGDRELIESTQIGNITACTPSSTPLATFCKEFYALDTPFLFADRETVYKVLDGDAGKQLLNALESVHLTGLGYMENGFRNITNSKIEITKPEDMKGMKLRTMENPIHMAFWSMTGASPTPMAFGELFTALQQKTVDGQENPFELISTNKFYEVQSFITESRHIYSPYVVLFNKKFMDDLSAENRKIVEDAMKIAVDHAREESQKSEIENKKIIEDAGVKITVLTEDQINGFRKTMAPVLDQVKEAAGAEIMDVFLTATNYQ